jgi:Icc protein
LLHTFALKSVNPSILSIKIAQITDLHLLAQGKQLMGLDVYKRLLQVIEHAKTFDPDAYFITGDCCAQEPVQEVYHMLRPILDGLGKPYYLAAGNHDDRRMMRNAFFLEGHNHEPIKGGIEVKGKHFLLLDTSPGHVDQDQVFWLSRALNQYPDADIVMHHPPILMGPSFMDQKYPLMDTDDLLRVLTYDGRPRKVFCGHYHCGRTASYRNLQVFLCPPTSFFIDPTTDEFKEQELPPAYRQLEWTDSGGFRAASIYVPA